MIRAGIWKLLSRFINHIDISAPVLIRVNVHVQEHVKPFEGQDDISVRSRSRSKSGLRSGVDTPGRFARPTHLPPHLPDHHQSASTSGPPSPTISNSSDDSLSNMDRVQRGARDDIHMEQQDFSGHSRIPRDRDFDDNLHTPTIPDHPSDRRSHSRPRGGPREDDHQHRRAFAVWGNDETDSGTFHQHRRAFAVWGNDETDGETSDSDP